MTFELTKKSEPERRTLSKLLPLWSAYANYHDITGATTAVTAAETWYKLNTETVAGYNRGSLSHSNNRVTNTGSQAIFRVTAVLNVEADAAQELRVGIFKDGSLIANTERAVVSPDNVIVVGYVELAQGNYVEIYARNMDGTNDIVMTRLNVTVEQL
jgi:hypothetical protein